MILPPSLACLEAFSATTSVAGRQTGYWKRSDSKRSEGG
jgi:hypothetical protein